MADDTLLPLSFPAVGRKKITAAFDGGRITSDGGVMLLAAAERRLQQDASNFLRYASGSAGANRGSSTGSVANVSVTRFHA